MPNFRIEKKHKNMAVNLSPCFRDVMIGDVVTVGKCRCVYCLMCGFIPRLM